MSLKVTSPAGVPVWSRMRPDKVLTPSWMRTRSRVWLPVTEKFDRVTGWYGAGGVNTMSQTPSGTCMA